MFPNVHSLLDLNYVQFTFCAAHVELDELEEQLLISAPYDKDAGKKLIELRYGKQD